MKTLFLIRHAKSSWDDTALPDKDRPLGDRGRRDAPKMGKRLAKRDVKPDLILSSPARRALTTAEIVAKKLDYKLKDIVVDDRLYAGAVHDLLNVIHKVGDKLERVMLFGHNPELTELAHRLRALRSRPVSGDFELSTVLTHPEITPRRLDCLAGLRGFELRNPCARLQSLPSSTSVARWRRRVFPTKGQAGPRPEK